MTDETLPFGVADIKAYKAGKHFALEYCQLNGFEEWSLAEIPVQWNDQDPNRHLNNAVYAKYLEAGRVGFLTGMITGLRAKDPSMPDLLKIGPLVLAQVLINYERPVFAPDYLAIAHRVKAVSLKKMTLEFCFISYNQRKKVAGGEVTMVSFDHATQKVGEHHPAVHKFLLERLAASENKLKARL
ncbi:hypothetical protein OIV83_000487 [Microbotryomycetes sp. JL201]|nr:hypothetical protein OIV83_000487 [Microbotryomycetes sp. JL201]